MNQILKGVTLLGLGLTLWGVDLPSQGELIPTLVKPAHAIIGRPMTPFSYAGAARRTTRRVVGAETAVVASTAVVATTAVVASESAAMARASAPTQPPQAIAIGTIVSALPGGCEPASIGGVSYSYCHGVYYRAGFQGNNVVYIVSQP